MPSVARIDVLTAELPFRFSFGHALAARRSTTNVFVGLTLERRHGRLRRGRAARVRHRRDGRGRARACSADAMRRRCSAAALAGRRPTCRAMLERVRRGRRRRGARRARPGARSSWRCSTPPAHHFAPARCATGSAPPRAPVVRYDAVIPFARPRQAGRRGARWPGCSASGRSRSRSAPTWSRSARARAAAPAARAGMPTCASTPTAPGRPTTALAALAAHAALPPHRPSSSRSRPPTWRACGASRRRSRSWSSSTSRCAPSGRREALAERRACDAFNIRVSKCGGLLASARIARIAAEAGLELRRRRPGRRERHPVGGRATPGRRPSRRATSKARPAACCCSEDLTVEDVLPGYGRPGARLRRPRPGRARARGAAAPARAGQRALDSHEATEVNGPG